MDRKSRRRRHSRSASSNRSVSGDKETESKRRKVSTKASPRAVLEELRVASKESRSQRKILQVESSQSTAKEVQKSSTKKDKSSRNALVPTKSSRSTGDPRLPTKESKSLRTIFVPSRSTRSTGNVRLPTKESKSLRKILIPNATNSKALVKQVLPTEITVAHMKNVIHSRPAIRKRKLEKEKESVDHGDESATKRSRNSIILFNKEMKNRRKIRNSSAQYRRLLNNDLNTRPDPQSIRQLLHSQINREKDIPSQPQSSSASTDPSPYVINNCPVEYFPNNSVSQGSQSSSGSRNCQPHTSSSVDASKCVSHLVEYSPSPTGTPSNRGYENEIFTAEMLQPPPPRAADVFGLNHENMVGHNWGGNSSVGAQLKSYFPSTSTSFWNPNDRPEKVDRMGNGHLLKNNQTSVGHAIRSAFGREDAQVVVGNNNNCHEEYAPYFDKPVNDNQNNSYFGDTPVRREAEIPVASSSQPEINFWRKRVNTSLAPFRFTKDDLSRITVIGNIDNKFIAAKLKGSKCGRVGEKLVLFDQHAVHERILLERIISDSTIETRSGEKLLVSVQIPELRLEFATADVRILQSCRDALTIVGLNVKFISHTTVAISSVPVCFVDRVDREPIANRLLTAERLVRSLLDEEIRHFMETRGAIKALPETVMTLLRSQACKTAIKFGDFLSTVACNELINQLKECNMPFQCAHGRPSVYPLLDLPPAV